MSRPSGSLVLFSGGVDSTLALLWARRRGEVVALEFDFVGRPLGERRAATRILKALRVRRRFRFALPLERPRTRTDGYVPGRNLFLHAVAQAVAEAHGLKQVVAGHHDTDARTFPDARTKFFRRLEAVAQLGRSSARRIPILTPLRRSSLDELREVARIWEAPLTLTWSCWQGQPRACGRCEKCRRRAKIIADERT